MKMSKLYGWLLATFMFLPIVSIAVRAIYVQKNPNAYQSYSASERVTTFINVDGQLEYNKEYYFDTDSNTLTNSTSQTISTYSNSPISTTTLRVKENRLLDFRFQKTSADYLVVRYYNDNNELITEYLGFSSNSQITFTFQVGSDVTIDSTYNDYIKEINTNVENTLDNAFEYSVNEFNNVGFNKINFTQWFTSFFTNGDNLYTTFINSYANYILFTSCAMAIPYFLYWFVMFAMSLMDRFARKDVIR